MPEEIRDKVEVVASKGRRLLSLVPRFDRRVWLLLGAMLLFRFGQGLYYPFSTIYFHNFIGIPLSLVGLGLAALAVASVVSGLISGPLTDRYGRKPVMLASLLGSAATFFGFAFVGGIRGYLAVSVAAGLLGSSAFDAARNAMVADVTPTPLRARASGLVRVGGNVGWALGPATADLVASLAGGTGLTYRIMFVGTAALTLMVLAALALLVRETLPRVKERDPSVVPLSKLRGHSSTGRLWLCSRSGSSCITSWYSFRIANLGVCTKGSRYLDSLIRTHDHLNSEHFVDLVALFRRQIIEGLRYHTDVRPQQGILVSFQPLYALLMAPKRLQLPCSNTTCVLQLF